MNIPAMICLMGMLFLLGMMVGGFIEENKKSSKPE